MMGCDAFNVSSTEPIEMSIMIIMTKARVPFMKMDQNMALGTADLALRVSSLMWSALSKPGKVLKISHSISSTALRCGSIWF